MKYNGSSPHSRGTQLIYNSASVRSRFIPALAGNTPRPTYPCARMPVHPRTRGEHPKKYQIGKFTSGSSPHSRGTLAPKRLMPLASRFIPALAGNTDLSTQLAIRFAVHPRTRGEHPQVSTSPHFGYGSSPHSRGTRGPHSLTQS